MSIKPPIKCPPDYSILSFRLTECKKIGVVKGITTQLAVDMQDFFVPVTNYEESKMTLKAGETKRINISSIGETWPLKESFVFTANPAFCATGTSHSYSLYNSDLTLIETISFSVNITYPTFGAALQNAINNSTYIKNNMSFAFSNFATDGKITVTANTTNKGKKFRHLFSFDTTGSGGYSPFPYEHPGNLLVPNVKYPDGAIKIMMIYPDYYKANVLSNCGCIDASGDMKSNKKYIEYAFDGDVNKINNPVTPILVSPAVLPYSGFQWQGNSTDHIGYHVKVGDMISLSTDPLLRGFVTAIEGYNIIVDTTVGNSSSDQIISHVWSPSTITWRKMGDFYLHTTAQDVTDDDRLYIETLWLRNPHSYDLPIKIVMSS